MVSMEAAMNDLNDAERDYVMELLRTTHKELLHELHHTATQDYKERLRSVIALNESATGKLQQIGQSE
jgi:hypothetical protein